jgi:hypothetical protein
MIKVEVPNGYYTVNELNQYHSFNDEPAIVINTHIELTETEEETEVFGYRAWYKDGQLHREGNPAVIHEDGREFFYLNGDIQDGNNNN